MSREPHIPIFLWIACALLLHLTGGEGAQRAADVLGERMDVQRFADSVRRRVRSSNRPMEVTLVDETTLPDDSRPEPAPADETNDDGKKPDTTAEPPELVKNRANEPSKPDKEPPPKPEEVAKTEPQKAPPPPKEPEKKPEEAKPDMPMAKINNRIAVVQHVQNENQQDNPNAEFIADQANHVKEQTQARITSTDQNDKDPTPGTAQQGPTADPGNALVNEVAQSDDSAGEVGRAPNEEAHGAKAIASVERQGGGASQSIREVAPNSREGTKGGAKDGSKQATEHQKSQAERQAQAGSVATPESPDVQTSKSGAAGVPEPSPARIAEAARSARPKQLPPRSGKPNALDFLGLGSSSTTSSGINLNLSPGAALAAIGRDELGRMRVADGERRKSKHRGSWRTPGIEKWRASIENYNSSVKPGNQTALNTARVPFATYLNQIHNRLHPIFADSFLASLDGLPADHALNKPDMRTNLEIVIEKDEGKIVKMGITRSSGSTMFDVAALESVQNAAPFGKPPAAIVSPDGNVYLHWEFYRNPYYACSTYFAHPFILKASPESAPPHIPAPSPPPFGPKEQKVPGDVGMREPGEPRPRLGMRSEP